MKLCIIDGSDFLSYPFGGQLTFLLNFIKGVRNLNVDISLVGITTREEERVGKWSFRAIGNKKTPFFPIYFQKYKNTSRCPIIPMRFKNFFYLLLNRRKIIEGLFDVLYIHSPELLLPFLFPKKSKIVVHTHGSWGHTSKFSKYKWIRCKLVNRMFHRLVLFMLRRVDKVIVVNDESLNQYRSMFPNQKDKFIFIPTCVDTELFRPLDKNRVRKTYGFQPEDKIVIFVGRLGWNKGLDLLLDSFHVLLSEIHQAKLVIVGDGEMREDLINKAKTLPVWQNSVFMGNKSRTELPRIINCADVSVLTSFAEGMPIAVLESLACGVPVVSVDVGDVKKVIKDGISGFLTLSRDVNNFKDNLLKCIKLHTLMKTDCLQIAAEYSVNKIVQKILEVGLLVKSDRY